MNYDYALKSLTAQHFYYCEGTNLYAFIARRTLNKANCQFEIDWYFLLFDAFVRCLALFFVSSV